MQPGSFRKITGPTYSTSDYIKDLSNLLIIEQVVPLASTVLIFVAWRAGHGGGLPFWVCFSLVLAPRLVKIGDALICRSTRKRLPFGAMTGDYRQGL
jgi:hypothetical protein